MSRIFWAGGLLALFFYFKGAITGHQLGGIIFYAIFLILPIAIVAEAVNDWLRLWALKHKQKRTLNDFLNARLGRQSYQKPTQENHTQSQQTHTPPHSSGPSRQQGILSPAQISQLNTLREHVSLTDAAKFRRIEITGTHLPNLVPEAGIFTSKISLDGKLSDVILMLASLQAVANFARLLESCSSRDFIAEGHLLPSRTGMCYYVFLVTSMRFAGHQIQF